MVEQKEFESATRTCDVVMKGGITSGVVYPLAVVELAKKYRLKSIGGTSAGALAAAITAAAEVNRAGGGFVRVAAIPGEIAETLFAKFQPDPPLRPLFGILVAGLGGGGLQSGLAMLRAAVSGYWRSVLAGAAPGLIVLVVALVAGGVGWTVAGLIVALVGAVAGLAVRIVDALRRELPAADYGICSGRTVPPGAKVLGLTDWLTDTIDRVAGRPAGPADPPLVFGDLKGADGHDIELAMVTTDLTSKRPYRLPFRAWELRAHAFSPREFRALFPDRVVDFMVAHTAAVGADWQPAGDLRTFPEAEHLPLVVAARMSLSFPGLIKAVPLHKRDFTLRDEREKQVPRRCLFSDGGLSSNFPIHFFDKLWPGSPTFAFALDAYSPARQRPDDAASAGVNRIYMPKGAGGGQILPLEEIGGLGAFLMRLLDSAKDWQDNMQSTLPGYRERIVRIALDGAEGGLNLNMPPDVIARLSNYGRLAGERAAGTFDFDEHRWRRFLVAMARIEATFDGLADTYDKGKAGGESFKGFLARYQFQGSYPPVTEGWKSEILVRAEQIAALGRAWRAAPVVREGKIPLPECDMRITPKL